MPNKTKYGLDGVEEVLSNLNKEIGKIEGRTQQGLIKAAIIIRRAMDKESPKIPVDTNNLRASFYIVTKESKPQGGSASFKGEDTSELAADHKKAMAESQQDLQGTKHPALIMGFSANYAIVVHEDMKPKSFGRDGAGAKFLEAHLYNKQDEVLRKIKEYAQIK